MSRHNRKQQGSPATAPESPQDATAVEDQIIGGDNEDVAGDDPEEFGPGNHDPELEREADALALDYVRDLSEIRREDDGPRVVTHPLLPGYTFPEAIDAVNISLAYNTDITKPIINTVNTGKPTVLYAVVPRAGEYDGSRGGRLDKRVPMAVIVAWDDYKLMTGAKDS
jgi:hypothetical protein